MDWLGGIVIKSKVEGSVASFLVNMLFEVEFPAFDVIFMM
jgi:hypothetical protein